MAQKRQFFLILFTFVTALSLFSCRLPAVLLSYAREGRVTATPTETLTVAFSETVAEVFPSATNLEGSTAIPYPTPEETPLPPTSTPSPTLEFFETVSFPITDTLTVESGGGPYTEPSLTPEFPLANTFIPVPPTLTPFQTSTFTPSPSPTFTSTPIPLPPWVSVRLRATDPTTVRLASGRVQLVEFFAFWCGICQAMAPIVHSLEEQYADQVNFVYLDIDDPVNEYFKRQLHYRSQPHFFLLDEEGKVLKQWIGYVSLVEFIVAIEAALW